MTTLDRCAICGDEAVIPAELARLEKAAAAAVLRDAVDDVIARGLS